MSLKGERELTGSLSTLIKSYYLLGCVSLNYSLHGRT